MKTKEEIKKEILDWIEKNPINDATAEKESEWFLELQQTFPKTWVENDGRSGLEPNKSAYTIYYDPHCDGESHDDFEEITEIRAEFGSYR